MQNLKLVEHDDNFKKCRKCNKIKQKNDFYKCKSSKDGLDSSCIQCKKDYFEKNKKRIYADRIPYLNTEKYKISVRNGGWKRDGMKNADGTYFTHRDYLILLAQQNGICAICKTDKPGRNNKFWPVDHDHKTGFVRWILCDFCNSMLGYARDNPGILEKAARMLREKKECLMG